MATTKLHELLAVEDSLNRTLGDAVKEATASFASKDHLFKGHTITIQPLEEDSAGHTKVAPETEVMDVAETVGSKLEFVLGHMAKAFNVYGRKERTNQEARADLVVNGEVLIPNAPATMLLGLENKLKQLRDMAVAIKTLDMSKGWKSTPQAGIFQARAEERYITKKEQRERVVIQPTETQPGQFTSYTEDVRVGKKITEHKSGLVTPTDKSLILGRIDTLLRAAKKARQRANGQEVDVKFSPGKAIKNFLLTGGVENDDGE